MEEGRGYYKNQNFWSVFNFRNLSLSKVQTFFENNAPLLQFPNFSLYFTSNIKQRIFLHQIIQTSNLDTVKILKNFSFNKKALNFVALHNTPYHNLNNRPQRLHEKVAVIGGISSECAQYPSIVYQYFLTVFSLYLMRLKKSKNIDV